jgi:glutathione S-transferase
LGEFTEAMDSTGPFFLGEDISLVDLVAAPWAIRLWVFDHFKGGKGEIGGSTGERWEKWLKAIEDRESVASSTSEKEHYIPLWQRYADDTAQSELAKATREGRGVP